MLRDISLTMHVAGVILWIGGSAAGAWTAAQLATSTVEVRRAGLDAVRRALLTLTMPGIALAWIGGLLLFVTALDVYARAGWLHGKIMIALVVSGLHGVLVSRVRRSAD